MKKIAAIFIIFCCFRIASAQTLQNFHDFNIVTILGDTISLSQYAGKKLLVVNTASYCGYTPQFTDLQALDSTYASYNFEVIGFPCNDFGGQDPGEDSVILGFCTGIYGVTFQMMSKVSIAAPDTSDVYKWLQLQSLNGVSNAAVTWNFNKFCIDENGQWVSHFTQYTLPFDTVITNWIASGNTTGIQTLKNSFAARLLSNPVKEKVRIQLENAATDKVSVLLYSAEGVFIDQVLNESTSSAVKTISYPVNGLSNGIYILKITDGNSEKNLKFSVVK